MSLQPCCRVLLFGVSALVLGCTAPADGAKTDSDSDTGAPDDTGTGDTDTAGDTSTLPTVAFSDLTITADPDVPTILTVTWTTDPATTGFVAFGETTAYGGSTAPEPAPTTAHSAVVHGLAAATTWHLRPMGDGEGGLDQVWTTAAAPSALPILSVSGDPAALGGYLLLPITGATYAVAIVDGQGRYVWWHEAEEGYLVTRAVLSRDGASVIYTQVATQDYGPDGHLVRVPLDGGEPTILEVPYLTHDFVELPDGTLACLTKDLRDNVVGDRIVEYAPDGTRSVVWSAFDYFDPAAYEIDESDGTWTHANALDYDEAEDAWYISLRNLDTILKSDRASRQLLWRLMPDEPNFRYVGGATPTENQHQFELLPDGGLLVFDNGGESTGSSRVVEYALDETANTATEAWSYSATPPLYVYALGDVDRLEDDRTLVTWSTAGLVQVVEADGTEVWRLGVELGHVFGYTERLTGF
ncbi:MAG: aryl-sulfate sulfotransferase [Pseudomonadota bacterium]|nr:aryl-sulfate sulfotransferase [Pseudomonadota bacterium]